MVIFFIILNNKPLLRHYKFFFAKQDCFLVIYYFFLSEEEFKYLENPVKEEEAVRNNSPFTIYFNKIVENEKKKCQKIDEENNAQTLNEFYYPKIFVILQTRFYNIPLWTSLMLHDFYLSCPRKALNVSRLSNNNVEAYFKHLKNELLNKNVSNFCFFVQSTNNI